MPELLIGNAKLVDGTGAPARMADVRCADGGIAEIAAAGSLSRGASQAIDGRRAPPHPGLRGSATHYDGQVTWDLELAPSSWHGVTTVVMGNRGVGFAPANPTSAAG